jgi:hypothetical protein
MTRKRSKRTTKRSITRFCLFGAVGFGIGVPMIMLGMFLGLTTALETLEAWSTAGPFISLGLGFAVAGAVGGLALGLALMRGKTLSLAGFGALGFLLGGLLTIPFASLSSEVKSYLGVLLVPGAVGGAALGVALGGKMKITIVILALAGALGFGIGDVVMIAVNGLLEPRVGLIVASIIKFALGGIIGGAVLGAALGFLYQRKAVVFRAK